MRSKSQSSTSIEVDPELVSVLSSTIDADNFGKYQSWLAHHVSDRGDLWRVKYLHETGVRTIVIFENPRHKFMFDVAWANSIIQLEHSIICQVARR